MPRRKRNILFVVHGMGRHGKTVFSDQVKSSLNAAMSEYQIYGNKKITHYVKVVPLNYDYLFEKQRQAWKKDSNKVMTLLEKFPESIMESWFSDSELSYLLNYKDIDQDTFFNTHILDVLLYRFTNVGERVRVAIAKEMVKTLISEKAPSYSILAHSLGTSVIHDTLHALFQLRGWKKKNVTSKPFTLHSYKASNLISISNVSRVLQSGKVRAYRSKVRPGIGGVCKKMLNVTHEYDPIARTKEFRPGDDWLDSRNPNPRGIYENLYINSAIDQNIHSIKHYLNNPEVNRAILSRLTGSVDTFAGTPQEIERVNVNYQARTINQQFKNYFNTLKKLSVTDPVSRQEIIQSWFEFLNLLEQVAEVE